MSSFHLTLCVGFYTVEETATSPSLEGVASCRRWSFSFIPATAFVCLSHFCVCTSGKWLPFVEVVPRIVFQRGGFQHLDSIWLEARPSGSKLISMQIYSVLGGHKGKPFGPQSQEICPLGSSCKNQDTPSRWVDMLLFGKILVSWSKAEKKSSKLMSTAYIIFCFVLFLGCTARHVGF